MGQDIRSIPVRDLPAPDPDNRGSGGSNSPCLICGRDAVESPYRLVLADGNTKVIHPADERAAMERWGDAGALPIGPVCRKRLPAEFVFELEGD